VATLLLAKQYAAPALCQQMPVQQFVPRLAFQAEVGAFLS